MPKHVAKTRGLAINGTAISGYCRSIEITDEADDVELTGFTSAGYKEYGVGFKDANVTAEIFAEFTSIHSLLQPLYANSGTFALQVIEDTTAAVSATNPMGTMTAKMYAYSPIAGAVGDAATYTATFRNASQTGFAWGTAGTFASAGTIS